MTSDTGQFRARQQDTFTKVVMSVVGGLLLTVVIGGVKLYADIRVMQNDLADLAADKAADERQDRTLSKQWRWLSHLQEKVDELRHEHDLTPDRADLGE